MKLDKLRANLDPSAPAQPSVGSPPVEAPPPSIVSPDGFLALIEMMREDGAYDFADEILTSIYDSVRERNCVTQGQHRAVLNIRHAKRHWEDDDLPSLR